jgi:hypothetical protein
VRRTAADLLGALWGDTAARLDERLAGLTDDEFRWEPVPDCWSIDPDPAQPGHWTYPYEYAPATPAPVTTIGWRLVHVTQDNRVYWEHAFGPGRRNFPDFEVPGTARAALVAWHESRQPVTDWLSSATDATLVEPRPSHLGQPRTAGEVIVTLIDEQVHHGAEIALLRDLYLRR